jgi:hypothetical protein
MQGKLMRKVARYILLITLFAASLYLFNDQRKKLSAEGPKHKHIKPRSYSIDELENKRDHIIKRIQDKT